MAVFEMDTSGTVAGTDWRALSYFEQGFIEAMFFTETGADSVNPAPFGFGCLAPEALKIIRRDCAAFIAIAGDDLDEATDQGRIDGYDDAAAGRDFWYTRNGHGVGFWSRDVIKGRLGDALDKFARTFPTLGIYTGDDGRLYPM